jgi:seryl-tRNA synthetase
MVPAAAPAPAAAVEFPQAPGRPKDAQRSQPNPALDVVLQRLAQIECDRLEDQKRIAELERERIADQDRTVCLEKQVIQLQQFVMEISQSSHEFQQLMTVTARSMTENMQNTAGQCGGQIRDLNAKVRDLQTRFRDLGQCLENADRPSHPLGQSEPQAPARLIEHKRVRSLHRIDH